MLSWTDIAPTVVHRVGDARPCAVQQWRHHLTAYILKRVANTSNIHGITAYDVLRKDRKLFRLNNGVFTNNNVKLLCFSSSFRLSQLYNAVCIHRKSEVDNFMPYTVKHHQGCGSRDLVLVSRPIKTTFLRSWSWSRPCLFLVMASLVLVLLLVSEGGLEQDLRLCVC